MKKILKIVGGVMAGVLILVAYLYYGVSHMPFPWKVTDPHDPRFVAENFRYEDYYEDYIGGGEGVRMKEVLRVMFPIGTPKDRVDHILFEIQPKHTSTTKWGASVEKIPVFSRTPAEKNVYCYNYVVYPYVVNMFVILVFYTPDDKVREIVYAGAPIFNLNFYGDK